MLLPQKVLSGGASAGLTIVSGTINANAIFSAHNAHLEIWSNSGNSPSAQIGSDSDSVSVSSSGEKTVTFSTPVPIGDVTTFWVVLQADGGDVNYNRHGSVVGTDVDGGDFEPSTTITNLVLSSTHVLRCSVLLSDGTRLGNRDTGTTASGAGAGNSQGIRITRS
jgi:hypothetical protein